MCCFSVILVSETVNMLDIQGKIKDTLSNKMYGAVSYESERKQNQNQPNKSKPEGPLTAVNTNRRPEFLTCRRILLIFSQSDL